VLSVDVQSASAAKKYALLFIDVNVQENAETLDLGCGKLRLIAELVQKTLISQADSGCNILHLVAGLVNFDSEQICVGHGGITSLSLRL
jgi:hypothetical protein